MKVLIINPIMYTSETDNIPKVESIKDTMIYALCMGFIKNGDEPVLIGADEYRPIKDEKYPFTILWFSCILKKIYKPRCLPYLRGLRSYIVKHKEEFDYIICSEVFAISSLTTAVFAKSKLLVWHELGAHNRMLYKLPSKFWYNVIARCFFKKIPIVPRSENAQKFIQSYCKNVLPIHIDHGVDIDGIAYSGEKENYFVVLSQLIERKHIDGIIDAFVKFHCVGFSDYSLKIIGDGVLREKLQEQVKALNAEDCVRFMGKLNHEQLMPILAKAKALLINTSKDNSMVSIVESIAVGTPVLTTPIPFNAKYIREYELGIVKENWSYEELISMCKDNETYVDNCIDYREKLSNRYFAELFNQIGGSLK